MFKYLLMSDEWNRNRNVNLASVLCWFMIEIFLLWFVKLGKTVQKCKLIQKREKFGVKATLQNSHPVYPLLIYNFNFKLLVSQWCNSSAFSRRRDGTKIAQLRSHKMSANLQIFRLRYRFAKSRANGVAASRWCVEKGAESLSFSATRNSALTRRRKNCLETHIVSNSGIYSLSLCLIGTRVLYFIY